MKKKAEALKAGVQLRDPVNFRQQQMEIEEEADLYLEFENFDEVAELEQLTNQYKYKHSSCSCSLDEIEGFIFGGFSSRFWMYRKHINSSGERTDSMPFYSWECITLQLKHRDVDLIIQNEKVMIDLLSLLIYNLNTVDGERHSGKKISKTLLMQQELEKDEEQNIIYEF